MNHLSIAVNYIQPSNVIIYSYACRVFKLVFFAEGYLQISVRIITKYSFLLCVRHKDCAVSRNSYTYRKGKFPRVLIPHKGYFLLFQVKDKDNSAPGIRNIHLISISGNPIRLPEFSSEPLLSKNKLKKPLLLKITFTFIAVHIGYLRLFRRGRVDEFNLLCSWRSAGRQEKQEKVKVEKTGEGKGRGREKT